MSTPSVVLTGYPPPAGYPPGRVPPQQGTPSPQQGTPSPQQGTPPGWTWQGTPPRLDLAGYPPSVCPMAFWVMLQSIMGYGYPPWCEQTNKVKLLPSRRTTYAGGKNYLWSATPNAKGTTESNLRNDVCFILSGLVSSGRRIVVVFHLQLVTERKQIYQFIFNKFVQLHGPTMISKFEWCYRSDFFYNGLFLSWTVFKNTTAITIFHIYHTAKVEMY